MRYSELLAICALEQAAKQQQKNSSSKKKNLLPAVGGGGECCCVEAVYRYLDPDHKGYITALDLQRGLRLEPDTWAAHTGTRMMIAQVSSNNNSQVISQEMFQQTMLGKRASSSMKLLPSWTKNMGKFVDDLWSTSKQ
eukprot:Sro141_g065880.2  (138) ;mRNA; f:73181-73594